MRNQVYLYEGEPDIMEMSKSDICDYFADCIFQIKDCGEQTIRYMADVLIRRVGPNNRPLESRDVVIEVECLRDSEHLRFADNLMTLDDLPHQDICIYEQSLLVMHNSW